MVEAAATASGHHLVATDIVRIYTDQDNNEVLALDGFSLEVDGGEAVGVVGPSGCGKSTFLRLVTGLDMPQKGSLVYDGEPIKGTSYDRAMVFQSAALFDWLTVYNNIAFGLKARKVFKGQEKRVNELIDMMGLTGFEDSYPYQISGGMASRTALARTFIQDPGLICLDEPLSSLDAFTRMTIQDEIVRMHLQSDAIFILVTHDIEEAVYLCDRIAVMSARPGRIIGEVKVDLPHPRDRVSDEFVAKRREVLDLFSVQEAEALREYEKEKARRAEARTEIAM